MVYEKEEKKEVFKEIFEYEFEEEDCTVKKSITANEQDIREAVEYILNHMSEEKIDKELEGYFKAEEVAGLDREALKSKVAWEADIDELDMGFSWELYKYFEEIAETDGDIVSAEDNAVYRNDYNAGMAYYRANC